MSSIIPLALDGFHRLVRHIADLLICILLAVYDYITTSLSELLQVISMNQWSIYAKCAFMLKVCPKQQKATVPVKT